MHTQCTVHHTIKKTLAYRHDQSYCFIAASNASGSKSNEISKLESGSPTEPFLPLPSSCRRCRCESCECKEVRGICGFVAGTGIVVVACEAEAAAAAAGRVRGGRNGFLVAAESGVFLDDDGVDVDDENERGTLRVMPSARLGPCPCVCDGGGCTCADINEVGVVDVAADADVDEDVDVDLLCRAGEPVIGPADAAATVVVARAAPFRTPFTAGGGDRGFGTGTGCNCCK